jgi:hypothetical protein
MTREKALKMLEKDLGDTSLPISKFVFGFFLKHESMIFFKQIIGGYVHQIST